MSKNNNSVVEFINANFFWFSLIIFVFAVGFASGSFWRNRQSQSPATTSPTAPTLQANDAPVQEDTSYELTPAVIDTDHITGASNPKITLIEYSDFSCGFCGRVHPTMKQVIENYSQDVAWVYRHYLLNPTGPAFVVAQASECVANYEGNDQFWQFINEYFERSASDNQLIQRDNLLALIAELGMNQSQIESCIDQGEFDSSIEQQISGGRAAGIRGTPGIIIVTADGQYDMIAGAAPYESFVEKIEQYL
ncbi:MAG: Sodium/proton antiporter [Microgenomates bacterium 39_7]|nr:MAG: Sodium/proton antiporter [Microgenomates bacterium 39_7]